MKRAWEPGRSTSRQGITLHRADIRTVDLPVASFDFIHARCFMMHVPGSAEVHKRFHAWLKPGVGWCFQTSISPSSSARGPGQLYNRLVRESVPMIRSYGGDALIGTKLPHLLRDLGFHQVGSAGVFPQPFHGEISLSGFT